MNVRKKPRFRSQWLDEVYHEIGEVWVKFAIYSRKAGQCGALLWTSLEQKAGGPGAAFFQPHSYRSLLSALCLSIKLCP